MLGCHRVGVRGALGFGHNRMGNQATGTCIASVCRYKEVKEGDLGSNSCDEDVGKSQGPSLLLIQRCELAK